MTWWKTKRAILKYGFTLGLPFVSVADVINYCVLMADACGLDIDEIVQEKIRINNEKYPVEKAKGKSDKYSKL